MRYMLDMEDLSMMQKLQIVQFMSLCWLLWRTWLADSHQLKFSIASANCPIASVGLHLQGPIKIEILMIIS